MRQIIRPTLFWLAISSPLFAANYRFVKIDFPNATATFAQGINARGDLVGRYLDADGVTHGFVLRKGVFSTIEVPNSSSTGARAINAQGDIVGRTVDRSGNGHGYLLRGGHFTKFDYPRASDTAPRGINNAGDITGNYIDNVGNEVGFVLQDGQFQSVRVPDSATALHPCSTDVWMAMDNERVLVGDLCTDADGGIHGYVRTRDGDFQIIDFPRTGAPCSALRWINERGDIVGVYANTLVECFAFQLHGFLLSEGKYTTIDVPGAAFTDALAINDDGQIVGDYTDRQGNNHGYIAVPSSEQ